MSRIGGPKEGALLGTDTSDRPPLSSLRGGNHMRLSSVGISNQERAGFPWELPAEHEREFTTVIKIAKESLKCNKILENNAAGKRHVRNQENLNLIARSFSMANSI